MANHYQAVKVSDHVYWVGAVDWGIRDFHGYLTNRGTTYNAFLIMADTVTLIDTVKAPFAEEMLSRIASVIDPGKIDYIISNHTEMDHSGGLPAAMAAINPSKVFASPKGVQALAAHFHLPIEVSPVKSGETLSLGNSSLTFLETPMLHWPDSMFTYLAQDQLLFSSDAFGMHLASTERFADELPSQLLEEEGAKYFANILMPFSPLVTRLLDQVGKLGLSIKTIAPDHGPIWRRNTNRMIELYGQWATQRPQAKAVVVYDTMWGSTEKMARAISEGLYEGGISANLMPLQSCHRSDIATELLECGALIVGSPTLNNNLLPTVADLLTYLKGLKPKNLVGTVFGSFGWSGEATGQIQEVLQTLKVDLVGNGIKVKYVPGSEILNQCHLLGTQVATRMHEVLTNDK